jgi:hypothetical protein
MTGKRRHWKEHKGRFWARVAIPLNLRQAFGHKTELTEPLGGDRRIADQKHPGAVARLQAKLEEARLALRGGMPLADSPPPLPAI